MSKWSDEFNCQFKKVKDLKKATEDFIQESAVKVRKVTVKELDLD